MSALGYGIQGSIMKVKGVCVLHAPNVYYCCVNLTVGSRLNFHFCDAMASSLGKMERNKSHKTEFIDSSSTLLLLLQSLLIQVIEKLSLIMI